MKVIVIGSGYVGLVSGACLVNLDNDVLCLDVGSEKINLFNSSNAPICEPSLAETINHNVEVDRLRFTINVTESVAWLLVQKVGGAHFL